MTALITVLHGITVWKGFEYVTGSCWAAIVSYQGNDLQITIIVMCERSISMARRIHVGGYM